MHSFLLLLSTSAKIDHTAEFSHATTSRSGSGIVPVRSDLTYVSIGSGITSAPSGGVRCCTFGIARVGMARVSGVSCHQSPLPVKSLWPLLLVLARFVKELSSQWSLLALELVPPMIVIIVRAG